MNRKLEIESRLERSLRGQVRAPQLDGRFKAAVWSRIEQQRAPAVPSVRSALPRWLVACNIFGGLVALALLVIIAVQTSSGVHVDVAMPSVAIPQVSPGFVDRLMLSLVWPVTAAALLFGLTFTRLGRRLRAEWF